MNEKNAFGGRPSVRRDKSKKMMIKIGHDKAIMKQYLLTKKKWRGPNGETALVPKDKGMGIMISAMISRELGNTYSKRAVRNNKCYAFGASIQRR
jgi:hypothetical protein